jgi:inosine/xanthosine triphosphatase
VQKSIDEYEILRGSDLHSCDVDSGVAAQPIGLEMIVSGAKNRAFSAYNSGKYDLAFGIESGIFSVPYTKSGYMDTSCCVIYDGGNYHIGFSSCFEYPKKMIESIMNDGKEICDIAIDMGFAAHREFREGL